MAVNDDDEGLRKVLAIQQKVYMLYVSSVAILCVEKVVICPVIV